MKRRRFSLRVDLLGKPIRQVIQGAIKVWLIIRSRKPREHTEKIKAFSLSLGPLREIEALRREGALTDDDAYKLRCCVVESATTLLEPNSRPKNPTGILSIQIWHKPDSLTLLKTKPEWQEIEAQLREQAQQDKANKD